MITAREVMERVAGLTKTAEIRAVRKEVSREIAGEPREAVIRLAVDLVHSGGCGRFLAHELVAGHRDAMEGLTAKEVLALAEGNADWPSVDSFGCAISGPAWREGRISDRMVHGWAQSKDRWVRRTALVSTVGLNLKSRGGRGDAPRTLALCERLIGDRDDMVVKAMSWALRALAVRDAAGVAEFVAAHEGDLAARVVREVRNKIRTGVKNPRL